MGQGHSSLNGVVIAMCDGNLDVLVLSKHCKRCRISEQKKARPEYEEWNATNQGNINHEKSSASMEAARAVQIFQSSIYSQYLGDGDTSSFKKVVESNPYSEFDIVA